MNWDRIEKNWRYVGPRFSEQWMLLTAEDLHQSQGKKEILSRFLSAHYGVPADEAEGMLEKFGDSL